MHVRAALLLLPLMLTAEPRDLFNGRDLAGWIHEGPQATFSAKSGEIDCSGRGNVPNWLRTDAEFENFRLTFEYKLAQWTEAAVIVRAPRAGRPMQSGIAIFLGHDFHENLTPYVTGAIAGVHPPRKRLPTSFDQWHRAFIELDGSRLVVSVDGETVQDIDLAADSELRYRLPRGFIGFPDLGHAWSVRNVRVEELGAELTYRDLFDGRTTQGWQLRGGGSWFVRDGVLVGANGHGILYAPAVLGDFELTALVRSRNRVNGGIFLRGSPDPKQHRGFEVQIYSPPDSVYPTGSVYAKQRARTSADFEDRWFLMQIRVEGSKCLVRLDGDTVAEYNELAGRDLTAGRIGLQIHSDNASVEFRDIRVREKIQVTHESSRNREAADR